MINKDTEVYGSFSANPGNLGCEFFNEAFQRYKINAIYKAFKGKAYIQDMFKAADTLNFSGFAISAPYKKAAMDVTYGVPFKEPSAQECGAANTAVKSKKKDIYVLHNTDYLAAIKLLPLFITEPRIVILGNGGLAGAVLAACRELNIPHYNIIRHTWKQIEYLDPKIPVINCTPVDPPCNPDKYLDCRTISSFGILFHKQQAKEQFKLYTGIDYNDP